MKIINTILLLFVCLFCTTNSFAAGSAWEPLDNVKGNVGIGSGDVIYLPRLATTDDTDAGVPAVSRTNDPSLYIVGGLLCGYMLVFGEINMDTLVVDDTDKPTSVVVNIKDLYGNSLNPDSDDTVETATIRYEFDKPILVAGGLHPAFTVVGNSKKFMFVPIFLND